MKGTNFWFTLGRIPLDFFAAFLAWILAWKVRPVTDLIPFWHSYFPPQFIPPVEEIFAIALFSGIGLIAIFFLWGQYSFEKKEQISSLALGILVWGMAIVSFFSLVEREVIFSRMMLFQAMIFTFVLMIVSRLILEKIQHHLEKNSIRIALVGEEKDIAETKKALQKYPQFSVVFAGATPPETNSSCCLEEIWIVDGNPSPERELLVKEYAARNHLQTCLRMSRYRDFANREIAFFWGIPFARPEAANLRGWGAVGKRLVDFFGSSLLLVVLSPVLILLAIGVRCSSPGSIWYISWRVGKGGRPFPLYKFRSMIHGAEHMKDSLLAHNHRSDGPFFKMKNDPRVTAFGRFLRRFSLDEWPQLLNVLRGEMSLLGPRPHFSEEIARCPPEFSLILSVRPGISGLSQVSGRSDLPFEEEMRLDLFYIHRWSLWLDVKIFFRTFLVIIRGKGAD